MAIQQRLYDVDELWELYALPENEQKRMEIHDGVLVEMSGPGGRHGQLAVILGSSLYGFAEARGLGVVTVETGYHPHDSRYTLLLPDVAFISRERAPDPFPEKFVPLMPDLAVEIRSPSDSLRELRDKAKLYLQHGTELVWIVLPAQSAVEIHRPQSAGRPRQETLESGGVLSGDDILPGFELELTRLFG